MGIFRFLFRIRKFIVPFFIIALFAGCSKQSKGFFATLLGTSIGSTIGAKLSKDKKKGAVVGAVVGGVVGTAASIAMGGGVISIVYGAVTTLGSVLVNCFARRKKKKAERNIKQVEAKKDIRLLPKPGASPVEGCEFQKRSAKTNCASEK